MTIRSFSGTHAWHPTVLADTDAHEAGTADDIIEDIESGCCPRCEGPMPQLPEFPAGSRITKCRSIPICGRCGSDEVYEQCSSGLSSAGCWPVPVEEIEARKTYFEAGMSVAILSGDTVISDDGTTPVVNPCNTGGWAQYGFADA
ncbi:hypothetical protein OKHIL_16930 [Mycolicibacterium mageritense]